MINPTIATTITMTTTFGSSKLWLATTSAAAMLRWPVPSAMTRFVPASGPPSNQPIPKPNAINRSPARIPRVPKTCRTLSMLAAVIKHTNRMRLALEIQSSAIEPKHLREGQRAERHQDEIGQQSEHDEPDIA